MSNPTEVAARTYAAAWTEPDPAARSRMLEACFAVDGRIAARGDGIRGRAALAAAIDAFFADPRRLTTRITSAIDVQGRLFRFRAVLENPDGTPVVEVHDAGEVDGDGRIALLLTFVGPLPERT
jgi:SnoaL-like domain